MKQKYILFPILFLGFILLDCSSTQQDSIAKTQNVEFLIEQGKLFWQQLSDSLTLKKAEHFISLACQQRPGQFDIAILYGQILYTRALFFEKDGTIYITTDAGKVFKVKFKFKKNYLN